MQEAAASLSSEEDKDITMYANDYIRLKFTLYIPHLLQVSPLKGFARKIWVHMPEEFLHDTWNQVLFQSDYAPKKLKCMSIKIYMSMFKHK